RVAASLALDVRRRHFNRGDLLAHSGLMPAALMIGHHFSASALWCAARASGVSWSRAGISCPSVVSRARTAGSAKGATGAALSLPITSLGVPLGAHSACQNEM